MNKTMDNQTNYESGRDILGNGNVDNMAIRKISQSAAAHVKSDIQDRIEISSNKDVDIGLELLVNNEKKNYRDDRLTNNNLASNIDNGIRMDTLNNEPDNLLVEDMLSNLDLDKTSTISQNDIDKLIDHADRAIPQRRPELVSAKDIENAIDNNSSARIPAHTAPEHTSFHTNTFAPPQMEDPGVIRRKKQEIIYKLEKMRRLGINGIRKFNMSNSLQEMEDELSRVKYERELESSVKFQRKCLMAFVTGTELLNNKFDFLDFKLDGWSEQVHDNIDEYNEVFEELATKYKTKVKMAPEIRLMFMLGGSAFMFHLTNSMFKNSIPGMEDIMKQNPDLMKQFANAAINQMQGEERQAAEMFNSFQSQGTGGQPKSPLNPENRNNRAGLRNPVNSFTPAYTPSPPPTQRPSNTHGYTRGPSPVRNMSIPTKMSAPVGVDDILNELRSNTAQSIDESIKSVPSNNDVADILSTTSSKKISLNRRRSSKRNIILTDN